jgi:hypothetical protein
MLLGTETVVMEKARRRSRAAVSVAMPNDTPQWTALYVKGSAGRHVALALLRGSPAASRMSSMIMGTSILARSAACRQKAGLLMDAG